MVTEIRSDACQLTAFDRNRYFYGKLMTARDFEQEQTYFNNKRWLINRLLFGSGIACGLEVFRGGTGLTPTQVTVKPGAAIDVCGREIVIPNEAIVNLAEMKIEPPTTGSTKIVRLCLAYEECPQEPIPAMKSSACEEVCDFNRVRESFRFVAHDAPAATPSTAPTFCGRWLNQKKVVGEGNHLMVERIAQLWAPENKTFEVAMRVTALADVTDVQVSESVSANASLIEPRPTPPSQFPTTPITLRKGEFFVYVYQVTAPAAAPTGSPPVMITINSVLPALPSPLTSSIEVVTETEANRRKAAHRIRSCGSTHTEAEMCVDIAEITLKFSAEKVDSITWVNLSKARRFRYTLQRTAELLECVRTSLLAEAGSPRPGHSFITFKDLEVDKLQPIGPANVHGTSFTVPRGDHVHALLFDTNSGLQFNGNKLRIEGDVGGTAIRFLNTVSGKDPTQPVHLTTKKYVDESIDARLAGLDWQESVKDKDLTAPPASPASGDRYLIPAGATGKWSGKSNSIATWNGTDWVFTPPDEGTAVFVEDENIAYLFVDGAWVQFLAMPSVAAGDGLKASGAILSVGKGKGIVVNPDDVAVDFNENMPAPIGMPPTPGTSAKVAHGDHSHALSLAPSSGLEFTANALRINGDVGGAAIKFLNTVSGRDPAAADHLATKRYVDSSVDAKIDAKLAGLDWQESVLDKDLTAPPAPTAGARYLLFGASLTGMWSGHTNEIAIGTGRGWQFIVPDEGTAVFVEDEQVAYIFVGGKWTQFLAGGQQVTAGDGLGQSGDALFVNAGDGIQIVQDRVTLAYATDDPKPVGRTANRGRATTIARSDHVHALPDFLNSTTGAVIFKIPDRRFRPVVSEAIDPKLGSGLISVILGLEEERGGRIYIGEPENSREAEFASIHVAAEISVGSETAEGRSLSVFKIRAAPAFFTEQPLPPTFRVRWYAYRVGKDQGTTEVIVPPVPIP